MKKIPAVTPGRPSHPFMSARGLHAIGIAVRGVQGRRRWSKLRVLLTMDEAVFASRARLSRGYCVKTPRGTDRPDAPRRSTACPLNPKKLPENAAVPSREKVCQQGPEHLRKLWAGRAQHYWGSRNAVMRVRSDITWQTLGWALLMATWFPALALAFGSAMYWRCQR